MSWVFAAAAGRRAGHDGEPHRHRGDRRALRRRARRARRPRGRRDAQRRGVTTKRPLAVAFFTNEEGARFQPDMFGSLVFTGAMPLERALATVSIDGGARRRGAQASRLCRRGAGRKAQRPRLRRAARRAGPDARGGRLHHRRRRGGAGHLVDRVHVDRPVEPRRHDADADAPRRRFRRRRRSPSTPAGWRWRSAATRSPPSAL